MEIVEVGPRDGLQNEGTILDTPTKVELVERLIGTGVRRIEATSFVNPARVPQLADADELMHRLPRVEGVSYIGLVLNQRGLERALTAKVDEINAVVVASDTFNRRNQGVSTEQSLQAWTGMAHAARADGVRSSITIAASFGCPFEGDIPMERVVELAVRVAEAQPDELAIADTIGVAVPRQVQRTVSAIRSELPHLPLRIHLHNTRNTGYANAIAAIEAGVATVDASVGGIGGCPFAPDATGNIATEDLIYLLDRSGIETGLDLRALARTAVWIGEQLGASVPGQLSRAGSFPDLSGRSEWDP